MYALTAAALLALATGAQASTFFGCYSMYGPAVDGPAVYSAKIPGGDSNACSVSLAFA